MLEGLNFFFLAYQVINIIIAIDKTCFFVGINVKVST